MSGYLEAIRMRRGGRRYRGWRYRGGGYLGEFLDVSLLIIN